MKASGELEIQYPPEMVLVDGKKISFTQWLAKSRDARVGAPEEQAKFFKAMKDNSDGLHF